MLKTKVMLLNKAAKVPKRAHDTDSGYDIDLIDVLKIENDVIFFKTGIAIQPPEQHYFELFPRSSMSKHSLMLANSIGVIDEHYRGEVIVPIRVLFEANGTGGSNQSYPSGVIKFMGLRPPSFQGLAEAIIEKQPKLVQLILKKRIDTEFEVASSLDETVRGTGGFGSTGSGERK